MKKVTAVIGSNFGDEGKGLVTDYLASREKSVVVRYNGGAQAGHTVTTPEGQRHVFGHFGAGSFLQAPTYLSQFFIVNPILFHRELAKLSFQPEVFVDRRCPVTTPYDMMINQLIEQKRGLQRHGSCGAGINETVTRHQKLPLTVADLVKANLWGIRDLLPLLQQIRDVYVPQRLQELGLPPLPPEQASDDLMVKFVEDCIKFVNLTSPAPSLQKLDCDQIVFEGAQGLRLDEHHRYFPHVTRSKTGLHNITLLCQEAGFTELDVHYLTRAYVTRHGNGPLERELTKPPYEKIEDKTNIPNPFQGTLRFAHLDLDDLYREVENDLQHHRGVKLNKKVVVTCVDQVDPSGVIYYYKDEQYTKDVEAMLSDVQLTFDAEVLFSTGPTRKTITQL